MKLGAEPKKVAALVGLIVIAGVVFYVNSTTDSTPSASSAPRTVVPTLPTSAASGATRRRSGPTSTGEFRVRVLGSRPEDPSPESIDPQLKLDLLAKVESVQPMEAGRNLFQFGQAPAPPKPIPAVPKDVPKIAVNNPPVTAPPVNPQPTTPPPPPPPPPINLKYYGIKIRKSDGGKQAFLQDGDDIVFARENDVIKQKYRIVKIAPMTIDVEDIQAKNTQTLRIQDLPPS